MHNSNPAVDDVQYNSAKTRLRVPASWPRPGHATYTSHIKAEYYRSYFVLPLRVIITGETPRELLSMFSVIHLSDNIKSFNFRCKILLDRVVPSKILITENNVSNNVGILFWNLYLKAWLDSFPDQECCDGIIGRGRIFLRPSRLRRRTNGPGDEDGVPGAGVEAADVRPGTYYHCSLTIQILIFY